MKLSVELLAQRLASALGADRRAIAGMVLRQGAIVVAAGLGLGLSGALGLARFLQSFLFGLDALDPLTFAAASAAMTGVALLAVSVPARRAAWRPGPSWRSTTSTTATSARSAPNPPSA